jgi:Arylsulfotransferase (ASST)
MIIRLGCLVLALSAILALLACSPMSGDEEQATAAPARQQVFRSGKRVSTDCGVEHVAGSPPGFAEPVGATRKDMPPPTAQALAIGADRAPVATNVDLVSPGYVFIEPGSVKESFIINNDKEVVATLSGDYYTSFSRILPDGHRMASSHGKSDAFDDGGGHRGCIEEYSANGELVWRLNLSTDEYIHHHDALKLPNGNVLAVVWEQVSVAEAVSQGRNPELVAESGYFWYDGVIEIDPYTAEIVWEWSARHHMVQDFDSGKMNYGVVADHPELLDINLARPDKDGKVSADWTHVNAMDYNADLDQIILSSNYHSEIWIIDHSTTPREAEGHTGGRYGKGGDLLFRWGRPENYDRGVDGSRQLFHQHDVQWINPGLPGAGNVLVFNNGHREDRPYSTVLEIDTGVNDDGSYSIEADGSYGPSEPVWIYDPEPPERFLSYFISGAQRLPNGNTLINQGAGAKLREVTMDGEIVWEYLYENEVEGPHMLFRANRYPPDHPGIQKILSAKSASTAQE